MARGALHVCGQIKVAHYDPNSSYNTYDPNTKVLSLVRDISGNGNDLTPLSNSTSKYTTTTINNRTVGWFDMTSSGVLTCPNANNLYGQYASQITSTSIIVWQSSVLDSTTFANQIKSPFVHLCGSKGSITNNVSSYSFSLEDKNNKQTGSTSMTFSTASPCISVLVASGFNNVGYNIRFKSFSKNANTAVTASSDRMAAKYDDIINGQKVISIGSNSLLGNQYNCFSLRSGMIDWPLNPVITSANFNGLLGEIIIYKNSISDDVLNAEVNRLKTKYGL